MKRLSVIAPVLNEVPWIGYSILSCLDDVHEFVYALDEASSDGTRELLEHVKSKYAHEKLVVIDTPTFHPLETKAYNQAFNVCIERSTGDACWFLHPDMLVTRWADLEEGPLAWWTRIKSYAGDFTTVITKGRCDQWKNIHAKKFGLHYYGGYGSTIEDFYHSDITNKSYKHFGTEFRNYPFEVADSGIEVNHYCELKPYKRRLEKMKFCLKTQIPDASKDLIDESATQHPRVTLEQSSSRFGTFEFSHVSEEFPEVITKYKSEFDQFIRKGELIYHG